MYDSRETELSYQHLKKVVAALSEPICIIGGWAVYFTVNDSYKRTTGRRYLGSRDIDLGFADEESMKEAVNALEKLDFRPLSFRYWKEIDFETGRTLEPAEATKMPVHRIFPMYVDLIIRKSTAETRKRLGFAPIDEPLLALVFKGKAREVKGFGRKLLLPTPEVLVATKLNSINNRDKEHKRVKDLCDLAALVLYGKAKIETALKMTEKRVGLMEGAVDAASNILGLQPRLLKEVARRLS